MGDPVRYADPSGRCVGPVIVVCLAAAADALGKVLLGGAIVLAGAAAVDNYNNYSQTPSDNDPYIFVPPPQLGQQPGFTAQNPGNQLLRNPILDPEPCTVPGGSTQTVPGTWHTGGRSGALPQSTVMALQNADGVEIVDARGSPLGEIDRIRGGVIIEDKSAQGINTIHPRTGLPQQTPEQWAERQIYRKTVVRIRNLQTASATRPTVRGSATVPNLSEVQSIRELQFHVDADTPELRNAVVDQLARLRSQFPDWKFTAKFGP